MRKEICCFIIFFPLFVLGQIKNQISWVKDSTWEQVKERAKMEKKYIYVDCFTTWCGPCKFMDKYIFSEDSVIEYMNANFVNVRLQMDTTENDNRSVKVMYSFAKYFEKKYTVKSYPTGLFFNPEGKLVHKQVGARSSGAFLLNVRGALDSTTQFYSLLEKYKSGAKDKKLVQILVQTAVNLKENAIAFQACDDYLASIDTVFTKNNILFLSQVMVSSRSACFRLFAKHYKKINNIVGKEHFAEENLMRVLGFEFNKQYIEAQAGTIDWNLIKLDIQKKAPVIEHELIMKLKVDDANKRKDWHKYTTFLLQYYEAFPAFQNLYYMNDALWKVFQYCDDKQLLVKAADWSKKTIYWKPNNEDVIAMDTYANLLYKSGNITDALFWEERALQLAQAAKSNEDSENIRTVILKMRKGLPTWTVAVEK